MGRTVSIETDRYGEPTTRNLSDSEIEAIHESAREMAAHHHRGTKRRNPFERDPAAAALWDDAYGHHVRTQQG